MINNQETFPQDKSSLSDPSQLEDNHEKDEEVELLLEDLESEDESSDDGLENTESSFYEVSIDGTKISNDTYYIIPHNLSGFSEPELISKNKNACQNDLADEDAYVLKWPDYSSRVFYRILFLSNGLNRKQYERENNPNLCFQFLRSREAFGLALTYKINPKCVPPFTYFIDSTQINNQKYQVATKYLPSFRNWLECYNNGHINNHVINEEGYIITEPRLALGFLDNSPIPLNGLGCCAALSVVLCLCDPTNKNIGLIRDNIAYQALLVDFGLTFESTAIDPYKYIDEGGYKIETNYNYRDSVAEQLNQIKSHQDILTKGLKFEIPQELCNAKYIENEICETIRHLERLRKNDCIKQLVQEIFKNIPNWIQISITEFISQNIQIIFKNLNLRNENSEKNGGHTKYNSFSESKKRKNNFEDDSSYITKRMTITDKL